MGCCRLCLFDVLRGPRRLMRVGLALILVGHLNLLLGAVLHGTVLRHVANPRGAVTPEYTTANIISVGSGLLSVSVGLVALLASRNLFRPPLVRGVFWRVRAPELGWGVILSLQEQPQSNRGSRQWETWWGPGFSAWPLPHQHWVLLAQAVANLLVSAACSVGLLLAVSLTVANGGRRLIADCHPGLLDPSIPLDLGSGHTDCPFDPTRIFDTALALWIPSLLMSAAEAALSGYCCVAALTLRGVGPCKKEDFQARLEELTELEPPKCKWQENVKLLKEHHEPRASQKTWV